MNTSGAFFEAQPLPEDRVVIPGVIDSCTNYIEHPDLVAERIARFASVAGRENVIAGTDCGFGPFAGWSPVAPGIAYAKLASLAEGARLASRELWGRAPEAGSGGRGRFEYSHDELPETRHLAGNQIPAHPVGSGIGGASDA